MRTALLYTRVLGSADGRPNVSATAGYTTFPSTTLRPRNSAGSSLQACFQPRLARRGWKQACKDDPALFLGLNVVEGKVVYPAVAETFGLPSADPKTLV